MTRVGIRQLRADLAASVRRAAAGEPVDVTLDGRVVARLGPVQASGDDHASSLAALVVSGALIAPRRSDKRTAEGAISVFRNVRLDLLLREIRG